MVEKITWNKCKKCGKVQHTSHYRCISCKHDEFDPIEGIGDAKLLTYTILNAVPAEYQDQGPYAIGIVEFENGVRAMGQITTRENLNIGMKLRPVYSLLTESLDGKEVHGFKFKPV